MGSTINISYYTTSNVWPASFWMWHGIQYSHKANLEIQDWKENLIKYNNDRENAKRVKHEYHVGDMVLMQRTDSARKLERPYGGPYEITEVFTNGTVARQKGIVNERVNICRIFPYRQESN